MTASDKLFYWLFEKQPDRILQLLPELAGAGVPDGDGYRFVAPVFKAREYRPDGLFLALEYGSELPALLLEAQMQADPEFLLRLYAESGRLLQQQHRNGQPIRYWLVVVLCPVRSMAFGDPEPVAEFLERRVRWLELQPALADPQAPPLLRTLALLLETEERLPATTAEIRTAVAGTALESQIVDATAAILMARFTTRPIPEICAMGGITLEDFSQSVASREIFGLGEQRGLEEGRLEGRQEGRQAEAAALTLRQLQRRCGSLTPGQQARIRALPLPQLETLAEALLDFQSLADLEAWLVTAG
jgi:predicted transposase YdaD